MQLIKAVYKKDNKIAVRTYHVRKLYDGSVQIHVCDQFKGKRPTWADIAVYDPDTAGAFADECRYLLRLFSASISRCGWHRIG